MKNDKRLSVLSTAESVVLSERASVFVCVYVRRRARGERRGNNLNFLPLEDSRLQFLSSSVVDV